MRSGLEVAALGVRAVSRRIHDADEQTVLQQRSECLRAEGQTLPSGEPEPRDVGPQLLLREAG